MDQQQQQLLRRLNELSPEDAASELLKCCGSSRWAEQLSARRPFESVPALLEESDSIWWSLGREDWLEAFSSHPKIGERKAAKAGPAKAQNWSEQEQSATRHASGETMSELARANREYESKFGFIFIVCATGKSADEMLALLKSRLTNEPETELRRAAEEQNKITRLRLNKLLNEDQKS